MLQPLLYEAFFYSISSPSWTAWSKLRIVILIHVRNVSVGTNLLWSFEVLQDHRLSPPPQFGNCWFNYRSVPALLPFSPPRPPAALFTTSQISAAYCKVFPALNVNIKIIPGHVDWVTKGNDETSLLRSSQICPMRQAAANRKVWVKLGKMCLTMHNYH